RKGAAAATPAARKLESLLAASPRPRRGQNTSGSRAAVEHGGAVAELNYQTGFGNEFATEALPGTLPQGQNAPQKVAHGLYAELWTGTPFTAPRASNRRSWVYRITPSAKHGPFRELPQRLL